MVKIFVWLPKKDKKAREEEEVSDESSDLDKPVPILDTLRIVVDADES